jgi:hypothetical protein
MLSISAIPGEAAEATNKDVNIRREASFLISITKFVRKWLL